MLVLSRKAGEALIIVNRDTGQSFGIQVVELYRFDRVARLAVVDDDNNYEVVRAELMAPDDPRWPANNPANHA